MRVLKVKHFYLIFLWTLFSCASLKDSAPKSSEFFELKKVHEPLNGLKFFEYAHKDNGLQVFLIPKNDQSNAVAYVTAYNVGSRDEEKGRTGLAHLFEHMMFRETKSYAEPFRTLSEWGGSFNAYTSQDQTVYQEMAPSHYLEKIIHFESERMHLLKITPEIYQTEKGAVISERKMRTEDSPTGRLFWELYQHAFDSHSYKTLPIGRQEDLDRSSFQDALDFYKKHYSPGNASIAIAGDFKSSSALKYLDLHYGKIPAVHFKKIVPPKENNQKRQRRKVINVKGETPILADAILAPSLREKELAAKELLLCIMIADSDIGYLQSALIEKGLAKSVGSSCYPNKDPNLSIIFISGLKNQSPQSLEKNYTKVMNSFESWLTDDRIEKIKLYFSASQLSSLRSPMKLALDVATNSELIGNPSYGIEMLNRLKELKKSDLIEQLQTWKNKARTKILLNPSKKSDPLS